MDLCILFVCVSIAVMVFWPAFLGTDTKGTTFYVEQRRRVPLAPPPWIFPIVWVVLYALITAAEISHVLGVPSTGYTLNATFISTVAIYFANITLNHYWSIVFFKQRQPKLALFIAVMLLFTAATVLSLYGAAGRWLSFGLYAAYVPWLAFACVLNGLWIAYTPTRDEKNGMRRTFVVQPTMRGY